MQNRTIKLSDDGSHTIYFSDIDEHYHSTFGAIAESKHVFIKNGFNCIQKKEINILELGFGTGLNAFLTCIESLERQIKTNYHTLELYPLDSTIFSTLNYSTCINKNYTELFNIIHKSQWERDVEVNSYFTLQKLHENFLNHTYAKNYYDVIYFDCFSPEKQPELWNKIIFEKLFRSLKTGGILTTYCAKGIVRRSLIEAGFKVERIPGAPPKREMLKAKKVE